MNRAFMVFFTVLLFSATGVYAELYDRGGGLIYDDVLDVTWLQDANYAATSGYTLTLPNGSTIGLMKWGQAMAWADQLVFGGFDDWRLPDAHNQDGSGPDFGFLAGGEMGYMYYDNLKNPAHGSLSNMGPFANIQSFGYWTQTSSDYGPTYKWTFNFSNGSTDYIESDAGRMSWAVRDGDVATVPIPGAVWLLGSGLIGFIGIKKKFKK